MEQEILPSLPAPGAALPENWRDGLTAKEALFVEHYAEYRNATQAYDHAYQARGGSYETRSTEGARLLQKPAVQRAVQIRQKVTMEAAAVDVAWLARRFLNIGTADVRELIGLKVGCCRYCHGEGHGYQWRLREYLEACDKADWDMRTAASDVVRQSIRYPDVAGGFDFNATRPPHADCPQCHGEGVERVVPRDTDNLSEQALLLFGGVKRKADGSMEIIVADRMKALELAGRIVGAFTDKVKISGAVAHLHAVADIRNVDQVEAGKIYRDFVAGHLAA